MAEFFEDNIEDKSDKLQLERERFPTADAPLDYGDGERAVPRVIGVGNLFREPEIRPDVERLSGLLDYSDDEYDRATESAEKEPEPSPSELRTRLESLAKDNNFREFRRQLNVQLVRLSGGTKDITTIRDTMQPLLPNNADSQAILAQLIDWFTNKMDKNV